MKKKWWKATLVLEVDGKLYALTLLEKRRWLWQVWLSARIWYWTHPGNSFPESLIDIEEYVEERPRSAATPSGAPFTF